MVESFEMVVAQYAQQLPLNGNETFTFPSLTVATERVSTYTRACIVLFIIYQACFITTQVHTIQRSVETFEVEGRSFTIGNINQVID